MKRSAWVALILLGGGLGLVSYLLFGELNPTLKTLGEEMIASVEKVNADVTQRKETVQGILGKHSSINTMPSAATALSILKNEQTSIQQIMTERKSSGPSSMKTRVRPPARSEAESLTFKVD